MSQVPVVDLSNPTESSIKSLDASCRAHGFFLIEGHGLDGLIDRTWEQTRRFFSAGPDVTEPIRRDADNHLGYFDRELTKRVRDHKEVFDFLDPRSPYGEDRNRWPPGVPGFRETLTDFFDSMTDLATATLSLIHSGLGLSTETADLHIGSRSASTIRLNHYTVGDPVPADQRDGLNDLGSVALGHHTDPGVITLLIQDDTGGLQALDRSGDWIDVRPQPGTIVVNLGDAMQVWTNDRYRAAVHRVVPMTDSDRYSIPLFFNPPASAVVAPIDDLVDNTPLYRPFTWREFIKGRMDDNFDDYGTDDIQISNYLVDSGQTARGDGPS